MGSRQWLRAALFKDNETGGVEVIPAVIDTEASAL